MKPGESKNWKAKKRCTTLHDHPIPKSPIRNVIPSQKQNMAQHIESREENNKKIEAMRKVTNILGSFLTKKIGRNGEIW